MTYTITILGSIAADAPDAAATEQTISDTITAAIASLPAAAGVADASADYASGATIDLMPPAPPISLADAIDKLSAALDELPTDGSAGEPPIEVVDAIIHAAQLVEHAYANPPGTDTTPPATPAAPAAAPATPETPDANGATTALG